MMANEHVFEITDDARAILESVNWSHDRLSRAVNDFLAQGDPREEAPAGVEFRIGFPEASEPINIQAFYRYEGGPQWQVTVRTESEELAFRAAACRRLAAMMAMSPEDRDALIGAASKADKELHHKYPGQVARLGPSKLVN